MFRPIVRCLGFVLVLVAVAGFSPARAARLEASGVQEMRFGTVARDAGKPGWIRLSAAGALTEGGAVVFLGGATGAAEFEVTGNPAAVFRIWLPGRIKIGTGVKVRDLVSDPTYLGRLGPDGRAIVRVGGTLKLRRGATTGALSASFRLRVKYL